MLAAVPAGKVHRIGGTMESLDYAVDLSVRVADEAWKEFQQTRVLSLEERELHVPSVSEAEMLRRAETGRRIVRMAEEIDLFGLPGELGTTVRIALDHAHRWMREVNWYWTAFDCGGWYVSLFAPAGHAAGQIVTNAVAGHKAFQFANSGDEDRYLGGLADIARLLRELQARTEGQAARGIFMPAPMVERARSLLQDLKRRTLTGLLPEEQRLLPGSAQSFLHAVETRLARDVAPAFDDFSEAVESTHSDHATATMGIWQYPDGEAIYADLVRHYTTLDLSAQEIHDRGLEEVKRIRAEMAALGKREGFSDPRSYRAHLDSAPEWRVDGADAIAAVFEECLERIRPVLPQYFRNLPRADYCAAALPESLEGTMVYGYYDQPKPEQPVGRYLFNTHSLTRRGVFDIAAFTYHELVPGHHLQIARQLENPVLHPLRAHSFYVGYIEGWAEYARKLASELGMYKNPAERFGSLFSDARQATRLVVDTGINVLGWSTQQACDYLKETLLYPDSEVQALIHWYACEAPAQSLCYRIGEMEMLRLREKMRAASGETFDISEFHEIVLRPGARPLPLVEQDIDRLCAQS